MIRYNGKLCHGLSRTTADIWARKQRYARPEYQWTVQVDAVNRFAPEYPHRPVTLYEVVGTPVARL
jgi:hypothetical protein